MSISEIVAILGLGLIIIGHLCGTIWWMSKVTSNLENMSKSFDRLSTSLSALEKDHLGRDDIFRELGRIESIANKAHQRIDECQLISRKDYSK